MVILVYHYFSRVTTNCVTCSVEQLESQLSYLANECSVLPLLVALDRLERGEDLPPRTVALTVDDIDKSFYDVAWPVFRGYGIPVFCNVITGLLGRTIRMGRQSVEVIGSREIEKLVGSGLVGLGSTQRDAYQFEWSRTCAGDG